MIVGRPINRNLDDGLTAEVTRLCTDGMKNACSMLSAAAWRTAKAMGYERLVTYTAQSEPGTSLKAAGWTLDAEVRGQSWNRTGRPRQDKHAIEDRYRWVYGERHPPPALSPVERMRQGSKITHAIRTGRTEQTILDHIAQLGRRKRRVNKQAVADAIGMSREHLSRRYGHLFS